MDCTRGDTTLADGAEEFRLSDVEGPSPAEEMSDLETSRCTPRCSDGGTIVRHQSHVLDVPFVSLFVINSQ